MFFFFKNINNGIIESDPFELNAIIWTNVDIMEKNIRFKDFW